MCVHGTRIATPRETLAALGAGLALADRVEGGNSEAPVTAGALGPPVAQPDALPGESEALAQLLGGDRVLVRKQVRVERSGQIEPGAGVAAWRQHRHQWNPRLTDAEVGTYLDLHCPILGGI